MKYLLLLAFLFALPLSAETHVLLFSGSTRKDSNNKKLVLVAAKMVDSLNAKATVIDLNAYPMPLYDGDLEKNQGMPQKAKCLQKAMIDSQVIVIASPEYNASISAVLKNALDWTSRAETGGSSRIAYKGKKFVLLSASPSSSGGKRGLVHLKAIIEAIGGTVVEPQFSLAKAHDAFDAEGNLVDAQVKAQLQALLEQAIH